MVVTRKDYQVLRYVDYLLWLICCHYKVKETTGLHSSFLPLCFYRKLYMAPLTKRGFWELPLQKYLEDLKSRLW